MKLYNLVAYFIYRLPGIAVWHSLSFHLPHYAQSARTSDSTTVDHCVRYEFLYFTVVLY